MHTMSPKSTILTRQERPIHEYLYTQRKKYIYNSFKYELRKVRIKELKYEYTNSTKEKKH